MQSIPMTTNGYKKLQMELEDLKNVKRPAIIKEIQNARAHGDLSENAEYKYAKEKQSFLEGKIVQIEDMIGRAQVVDPVSLSNSSTIKFGATITIQDPSNQEVKTYQIVGKSEADLTNGLISYDTPLAAAMINKEKNSIITFTTPRGTKEYLILEIQYI